MSCLKKPKPKRERRVCLCCDRMFWSVGVGNRICRKCHKANDGVKNTPTRPARMNGRLVV